MTNDQKFTEGYYRFHMSQQDINEANRKSALEQIEQDERNDKLKAESKADALFNRPHKPSTSLKNPPVKQEIRNSNLSSNKTLKHHNGHLKDKARLSVEVHESRYEIS